MMGTLARTLGSVGLVWLFVAGCSGGPSRVSFVSHERPSGYGAQGTSPVPAAHSAGATRGSELGDDDFVEPERPAAETKQERALVHIHGPNGVCSGVVIGSRIVATAQRCVRGQEKGVTSIGPAAAYRIEVASSSLTWTNRRVKYAVLPQCDEAELDVALLVLEETVPSMVVPLKVASSPNTGANVQALGFGHCAGSKTSMRERMGVVRSRTSQAVVIDVPLCKGDVGGPVVDGRDANVIGLISRRDDPEGSPLMTSTIARLDTVTARELIVQATLLADGSATADVQTVACR